MKERLKSGKPLTTAMANVVLGALARCADLKVVGALFDSLPADLRVQPDADSYHAVIEAISRKGGTTADEQVQRHDGVGRCEIVLGRDVRAGHGDVHVLSDSLCIVGQLPCRH